MIHKNSTLIKKSNNKFTRKLCMDSLRPNTLVMGINLETFRVEYATVLSVVKVKLPCYKLHTSRFDILTVSPLCHFYSVDGMKVPWNPVEDTYDLETRLVVANSNVMHFPFVTGVEKTLATEFFYDVVLDKNLAILVDGYLKVMGYRR